MHTAHVCTNYIYTTYGQGHAFPMVPQRGSSACVSIKGALVIGAFIIIASIFSAIAPGMGAHTANGQGLPACPAIAARPSGLSLPGNVLCVPAEGGTGSVQALTCTLALDEAADPVLLDRAIETVMTPDTLEILPQSSEIIPGTWSAVGPAVDGYVLSPGESVDITIRPPHAILTGSAVTINIRPQDSLPLSIRLTVPADIAPASGKE